MLFIFWPIVIFILNIFVHKAGGIKGVWLKMPEVVRAGSTVTFVCQFDMDGAPLYSVKWYRGNYEFYRYMPRERPPANAFPIAGLDIDLSGSNAHQVTLRTIPGYLSGPFTCEVSADAPYFSTAYATANLSIVEMDIRRPILNVPSSIQRSNSQLIVNCSAQPTNPLPQISFFLDDVRVGPENVHNLGHGFASLEVPPPKWAGTGPRWIRCEASVPGFYHLISNGVAISYLQVDDELTDDGHSSASNESSSYLMIFFTVFITIIEHLEPRILSLVLAL